MPWKYPDAGACLNFFTAVNQGRVRGGVAGEIHPSVQSLEKISVDSGTGFDFQGGQGFTVFQDQIDLVP